MRRLIGYAVFPAIAALMLVTTHQAWAFPSIAMKTDASCATCHSNPAGGADLTDVGKAYQKDPSTAVKSVEGSEYVGAKKCKICHLKYHKAWSTSAHATALANLAKADAKAVAEVATKLDVKIEGSADKTDGCVKCHVTGFHLAGGYPGNDDTKAELSFVGCESCHGPGSQHIKAAKEDRPKTINKNVTAAMCMDCHTKVMSPKFDFDTYKAKGVHKVATE
jgi:hypothetical protein